MSCETCTQTKVLTRCTQRIDFGTYPAAATDINIYIDNIATSSGPRLIAHTTGGAGELVVATTNYSFLPNQVYKAWMNTESDTMSEEVEWTLPDGVTAATCVLLKFTDVFDASGGRVTVSEVDVEAV